MKGELFYFSPSSKRRCSGESRTLLLLSGAGRQGMAEDKQLPHALSGHEHPELAPAFLPKALEGALSPAGHSPAHELELKDFSPVK